MSQLINGDTTLYGTVSITKQNGSKVTLDTGEKYVTKDIDLTINVQGGSATTPATTITANPTITVSDEGVISATVSKSQNVTPTVSSGFVSTGTAGQISVSGSATRTLDIATVSETLEYLGIS